MKDPLKAGVEYQEVEVVEEILVFFGTNFGNPKESG